MAPAVYPRMRVWITAFVSLMLAACGGPQAGHEPKSGGWNEPSGRYEYTLMSSCGEQMLHGLMRLTVNGGEVVGAVGLDESGRATVAAAKLENLPTLKDLVDQYETAVRSGADKAKVEFDPADGHPTNIDLDPYRNAIDDELCYRIWDYRVL